MSTYEYRPNGAGTRPIYDIGSIGWELPKPKGLWDFCLNTVKGTYLGMIKDILVPTYGFWGGPGWSGNDRPVNSKDIKWEQVPCYNKSIIVSEGNPTPNPDNCLSLLDAVCKNHDWRYYQAAEQYKRDGDEVAYAAAILLADVLLLEDVETASDGSYTSPAGFPAGTYNEVTHEWEKKIYTGTLDDTEELYLAGLVPLFTLKIMTVDNLGLYKERTIDAVSAILAKIPIVGTIFEDPTDPLKKTIVERQDDIIAIQNESKSLSDAWIVDLNIGATFKPVHVTITYGQESTKADKVFELPGDKIIRINGGSGSDDIKIVGANGDAKSTYTFEINGGGGIDTYYLDSEFNYKLIDSGYNRIYVEDGNGGWMDISSNFYAYDTYWLASGGSVKLTHNSPWTLTLPDGNTIDLGDDFQYSAFGINLITLPANPTSFNAIYLDTEDPDNTDHRDTWLDGLSTSADDKIIGGSGHDVIVNGGTTGGIDWLQGNAGNDFIQSFSNNNAILQGGSGVDALMGGGGSDQIFCDTSDFNGDGQIDTMAQMIARGETAPSMAETGDLAQGGSGNDFLYGSDAQDGLFGNHGNDVIAGGGGDDIIYGDGDSFYIPDNARSTDYWNWSFIIQYDAENQSYMPQFSNINFLPGTYEGGDDVIYGGSGNDYIDGGGGDDEIYGGTGNDTIFGGIGYDFIEGGEGDDILVGDNGVLLAESLNGGDYIDGGAGKDAIWGNGGDDNLFGGADDDTIYGGEGDDYLDGEAGNDILYGNNGADVIFGGAGNDTIDGGEGDDYLDGEGGENVLYGGEGNDVIFGGDDADLIEGDYSNSAQGDDYIDGMGGNDTISGCGGSDTIYGGEGDDVLHGDAANVAEADQGDDFIEGEGGNDYIVGYGGNDTLFGGDGNDSIWGGEGNDYLEGEAGEDRLYGGAGADVIYGGAGNDRLHGDASDVALEDQGDDFIDGGGGNDYIVGYGGNDTLFGGDGSDSIWGGEGNDVLYGEAGNDQLSGEAGHDYIEGGAGDDVLQGGAGNDTLIGGDGNDYYLYGIESGVDVIQDSANDYASTADYVQFIDGITFSDSVLEFVAEGKDLRFNIIGTTDSLIIQDWFSGVKYQPDGFLFADSTYVSSWDLFSAMSTTVYGTSGNDYLTALCGNNIFIFGTGTDIAIGGDGHDLYIYNLGDGEKTIVDTSSDTQSNRLIFGEGITADDLQLSVGSLDILIGNSGDVIHFDNFDQYDAYGPHAIDAFEFADGTMLTYNELINRGFDITGTSGNDQLSGTNVVDRMIGLDGNDYIAAGAGNDRIEGGRGADTLVGGGGNDVYVFNPGDGVDTIYDTSTLYEGNKIIFGNGITADDLTFVENDGVLTIHVGNGDDAINLMNFDQNGIDGSLVVRTLQFADGSQINLAEFLNQPPFVATPLGDQSATEDSLSAFAVPADTFKDIDAGDSLTYSATLADGSALPAWLSFDAATQTFSGTPGNDEVGTLSLKVTAMDMAGASASDEFDLTVINVNDAPVVANPLADKTIVRDSAFSLTIPADTFADVDAGDSLTYSVTLADGSALPAWLSFDAATQIFSGTPGNDEVGTLSLKLTATDMAGASASDEFDLTVINVNNAPVVANALADQNTLEDEMFTFTVPADTFKDIDAGDNLTYSVTLADGSALPAWLSFDAATQIFSGTPGNDQVGTLSLKVTATDMAGASASDEFDLTVINVNDAPVVANAIINQSTLEDELFTYTVPVSAFNDVDAGDTLTYRATLADGSALPSWLSFDEATQTFSGTPTNDDVGTLSLKVIATDIAGASASDDFNITVENVNDVPLVSSPLVDQTTLEDELFTYTVPVSAFNDVDVGDTLTYRATLADGSALPSWLSFDEATQTFSGTPGNDDVGTLSLKVTATDMAGASVSDDFDVTIVNVNDAPVVANALADQNTLEDAMFSFTVPADTFADVDACDILTYSATLADGSALPSWLTFNSDTMTISGTPGNDDVGTLSLKVTATDMAGASVSDDFDLVVQNADINNAPVLVNQISDQTIAKDAMFSFTVPSDTFADIDAGDNLTYSATLTDGSALPAWLSFDAATQTFSGTPNVTGKLSIKVTATDNSIASVSGTFDLDVRKFVYGSSWMELIITSSDNDLIYAFGGMDSVYSGSGDDIIYGGSGNDFLYGESGDDLIYGEDGNDYLCGGCGNDTLDGGEGADKMIGGPGNDTYVVDRLPSGFLNLIPGDEITEYYNEGIDTVKSSVSYTLGSNVENLTLTGTSAINGTGNSLNNVLIGNSAANTLTGNAGNDTLAGGLGNDILYGGTGSDTYLFGNADGKDTLNETAGVSGDTDTLKFAEATTTQPVLVKQGNDLYVFIDENNYVRIANEFQATNYGIERLEVSDGHYISRTDIQTIVDTMSYINNDSGMDVMQKYNAMMNDQQYDNILAASWQ
jgi:Ca2+-binding RTX toxin-like protein